MLAVSQDGSSSRNLLWYVHSRLQSKLDDYDFEYHPFLFEKKQWQSSLTHYNFSWNKMSSPENEEMNPYDGMVLKAYIKKR